MRHLCLVGFFLLFLLWVPALAAAAPSMNISASQARELMAENPEVFLLDVRTPMEHRQGHIPGNVLIPIDQIMKRLQEIPRDRPVLVYCAVGSRSSQVANYLERVGYPEVYNLTGGISAWQLRGYPVAR